MFAAAIAQVAPAPSISGFIAQYVQQFFNYANQASESLSAHLISHEALAILAACVIIRILYVALPAMLDGDLSSLAADATSLVVTVFIILTLFAVWNGPTANATGMQPDGNVLHITSAPGLSSIRIRCEAKKAVVALTNDVASSIPTAAKKNEAALTVAPYVCGTKGGGVSSAVQMASKAFGDTTVSLITAMGKMMTVKINIGGGWVVKHIAGGLSKIVAIIITFSLTILILAVMVVVFVVLLLDIIMAWAHIIIPLTFGPAVIAFYPINPQWARNVVSSIAAGLISYAATLFVMLIVVGVFIGAADSIATTLSAPQGVSFSVFGATVLGKTVPLAFIGALFAYSSNGFVSAAMALVSGSDHFSRHRGQVQGNVSSGVKKLGKRYLTGGTKK